MNKILEFIRKHSKITVILIILCSLLPLIVVHILFKWNSGIAFLVAEWSAGELLGYIGTLLSFWGTIILGWLALQASNKANELSRRVIELEQDHYRLEMRPFVLVSNWKAYEVDSRELVNDPKKKFIQIGLTCSCGPLCRSVPISCNLYAAAPPQCAPCCSLATGQ